MHGWAASMQLIWFYATFHTLFSFYPSLSLSVSPSSTLYIQIKLGTGWSERFYFTSRITLIFKIFTRGLNSTRTFQITLHIHTDMKLKLKCKSIGKTAKKMKKIPNTYALLPFLLIWTKITIPLHCHQLIFNTTITHTQTSSSTPSTSLTAYEQQP